MTQPDPRDVDTLVALRREIELRWTGEFADNAVNTLDAAATTITALQAELAALREALEPFARLAREGITIDSKHHTTITVPAETLFAAQVAMHTRAALGKQP